jgi:hypothetical protein
MGLLRILLGSGCSWRSPSAAGALVMVAVIVLGTAFGPF